MGQLGQLVGVGTVIESPTHGPELCLGVLMLSLPPQGGGPPIANWDWSAVTGYERMNGTTWGTYEVVGTYDGQAFTLTRSPVRPPPDRAELDLGSTPSTPCPEPKGGWHVHDPSRTTDRLMHRTLRRARRLDGYAGAWLDQSINPASRSTDDEDAAELMNDPMRLIINVAVTRDLETAERRLREVWGGAMCVSLARYTKDELAAVRDAVLDDVFETGNLLSVSIAQDHVGVDVIFDDGALQEDLDRRHGVGLVVVTSALRRL
jgi:hypothetical protein